MKKLAILALAACMLTSITACGNRTEETAAVSESKSDVAVESTASVEEEEKEVVEVAEEDEEEAVKEEAVIVEQPETEELAPEILEKYENARKKLIEYYKNSAEITCPSQTNALADEETFAYVLFKDTPEYKEALQKSLKYGLDWDTKTPENKSALFIGYHIPYVGFEGIDEMRGFMDYLASDGVFKEFFQELLDAKTE